MCHGFVQIYPQAAKKQQVWLKIFSLLDVVVHAFNPSTQEGVRGRQISVRGEPRLQRKSVWIDIVSMN